MNQPCMCLHRRKDGREQGNGLRAVLLHIGIHRGAAGRDHGAHALLTQKSFIFRLNEISAFRSFTHIRKAELLQRCTQRRQAAAVEIRGIGRGHACNDFASIVNQRADACNIVHIMLGILRANDRAIAAKDTVTLYDHGAMVLNFNGFHRANADALAAVLTVNAFKLQDAHRSSLLQPNLGST